MLTGAFLSGEFHESVMAFVEQFADVEAVDSVLPGSERARFRERVEFEIMSPPYAETHTRRFLSWANVMFRQKRLSCSSLVVVVFFRFMWTTIQYNK